MKSYYNGCRRLSPDEFNTHLEVQNYYGIQTDHRRRADGTPVYTLRGPSSSEPTPEKTTPHSVTPMRADAHVTASSSRSTNMSSSTMSLPPLVRPLDVTGQAGEAIMPESLLPSDEQALIREFRAQKQAGVSMPPVATLVSVPTRSAVVAHVAAPLLPPVEVFKKMPTTPFSLPVKEWSASAAVERPIAYSPQHTAESCEQLIVDSQQEYDSDNDTTYHPEDIAEFWRSHQAAIQLDREVHLVNELGDVNLNVVGFADAGDTSDDSSDPGSEAPVGPLSRYVIKRPCELRNELEIHAARTPPVVIDPEQVMRYCSTVFDADLYQGSRMAMFRESLQTAMKAAIRPSGFISTAQLRDRVAEAMKPLYGVVGDSDEDDAPKEPGEGGADGRTTTTSKGPESRQRDRSPQKTSGGTQGAAALAPRRCSGAAGGDGDDEDEDDERRRKKNRAHPGQKDAPADAADDRRTGEERPRARKSQAAAARDPATTCTYSFNR